MAVGFAALLNLAIVDSLIWPELFDLGPTGFIWGGVGLAWLAGFWMQFRQRNTGELGQSGDERLGDALFIQAQTEYLNGNWDEAEWILGRLLFQEQRDVEARLLLATLQRHRRQFDQARGQLQILKRFDESVRWSNEIEREFELLAQFEAFVDSSSNPKQSSPTASDQQPPTILVDPRRAA